MKMGTTLEATCRDCGHSFTYNDGPGFQFALVRCNKCGGEKQVPFDKVGEGVSHGDHKRVEEFAGKCMCGGKYKVDAVPRCPKCKSKNFDHGGTLVHYD